MASSMDPVLKRRLFLTDDEILLESDPKKQKINNIVIFTVFLYICIYIYLLYSLFQKSARCVKQSVLY